MTDPAWTIRDVGRQRAGQASEDRRLVTDEDQLVGRVGARVVEGAGDDLARTVVAAHRVDGDADADGIGLRGRAAASSSDQLGVSSPPVLAGFSSMARRPW